MLAKLSFTDNSLNQQKADIIVAKLKRKDARAYIRALRLHESYMSVNVLLPYPADQTLGKKLQIHFPDKKIVYTIDKSVLAGMRIIENDILYDYSLEAKVDRLIKNMYETND